MKKKKTGRFHKMDKYLYRNSYLYKWGKRIFKNRIGRLLVLAAVTLLLLNTGFKAFKIHQVKQFLRDWQQYQNNQQYREFIRCIDMSPGNPDRLSFPDWNEQFFEIPVRLELSDLSVDRVESGLYRAEMTVNFQREKTPVNRFRGVIFVREKDGFRIIRVEI